MPGNVLANHLELIVTFGNIFYLNSLILTIFTSFPILHRHFSI